LNNVGMKWCTVVVVCDIAVTGRIWEIVVGVISVTGKVGHGLLEEVRVVAGNPVMTMVGWVGRL